MDKLLSSVEGTDGGIRVSPSKRAEIDSMINELNELGKSQATLQDPRLFSQYQVAYTSTKNNSPPAGGLFRSKVGRVLFVSRGLFQHLFAPDTLINLVCFRMLGIVKGCVTLRGKLSPVKDKRLGPNAVTVKFERPRISFGGAVFQFGPLTRVRIAITYLDDRVRIGVGSRGSLFVFRRGEAAQVAIADEWKDVYEAQPLPTLLLPLTVASAVALTVFAPWYFRVVALVVAGMFAFVLRRGGSADGFGRN